MKSRTLRLAASATSTFALIAAGIAAATTSATADPASTAVCLGGPEEFPADELAGGQKVTGLTTAGNYEDSAGVFHDSSVTPEQFTGTYLHTLQDDSGDILVFQLEGSRITQPADEPAGIWSGMSGSPVYAADGRLIGAVAYTFGSEGTSKFAGVTPAADMFAMLDTPSPAPRPATIKLSASEKKVVTRLGVPALQAEKLSRLDPVSVSGGGGGKVSNSTLAAIARKAGQPVPRIIGAGGSTQAAQIPIVPGGNLAAADAFGSVPAYSVGTATAICDGQVLGFGHPAEFAPSSKSIHGAVTAIVQASGATSYKLTNLGAPSGTLAKDGLNGILGKLGAVPTYPTITSTTNGRQSISTVPNQRALPYIAAMQAYRDTVVKLNQDAGGEAVVSWKISYTRANGAQQSFSRSQRYASSSSIGEEVTLDVAGDISTIYDNEFENVKITGVTFTNTVRPTYKAYKIGSVEFRTKGKWNRKSTSGSKVTVRAGRNLKVRVNLVKADKFSNVAPTSKVLTWKIPKSARGASLVTLAGNASSGDDFEDMEDFGDVTFECDSNGDCTLIEGDGPKTFDALIKEMKALPRQDGVSASYTVASGRSYARSFVAPGIVSGDFNLKVNVRK